MKPMPQRLSLLTLFTLVLMIAVPVGDAQGRSLPTCPGSPLTGSISDVRSWNYCEGTITSSKGDKYVGEWKDDNENGQGIYTLPLAPIRMLSGKYRIEN